MRSGFGIVCVCVCVFLCVCVCVFSLCAFLIFTLLNGVKALFGVQGLGV